MQKTVNLIALLFSATILVTGDSYRYLPALLGVISLLALPFTFTLSIDKEIKKIMLAFFCFVSLTLVSLLLYGGKMSQADTAQDVCETDSSGVDGDEIGRSGNYARADAGAASE